MLSAKAEKDPNGKKSVVFSDQNTVNLWVVQRYLSKPYLLGGCKFDIRVYALVPSTWPLLALVYKKGFCRLGTAQYKTQDHNNLYAHLTNFSVNK